jgi:hypothetical protein
LSKVKSTEVGRPSVVMASTFKQLGAPFEPVNEEDPLFVRGTAIFTNR